MTTAQRAIALRSAVATEMKSAGTSYSEAFSTVTALNPDLVGKSPSLKKGIFSNSADANAARQRNEKIQELITDWLKRAGLDRNPKSYNLAFNAVARDNPSLFAGVTQPSKIPSIMRQENEPGGKLTPAHGRFYGGPFDGPKEPAPPKVERPDQRASRLGNYRVSNRGIEPQQP